MIYIYIYIYLLYSYGRISFCKVKKCEILSGLGGTGVLIKKTCSSNQSLAQLEKLQIRTNMPSILFHSFQNTFILFGLRMLDPLVKPKYVLLSLALP